jgi:hypothetical protein
MKHFLIGTAAAALMAGSASAATFTVAPGTATGNNAFQASINSFFGGAGNVGFGTLLGVTVASGETVTFTLAGAESGNTNTFTANFLAGADSMTESNDGLSGGIGTLGSFDSISGSFAAGALAQGDLQFSGNADSADADFGHPAFGVYFDKTKTGNQDFLLAYDDNATDDDHDDMIVSVSGTVAPIPLPAAAWMLIAGLGGLAALRRTRA